MRRACAFLVLATLAVGSPVWGGSVPSSETEAKVPAWVRDLAGTDDGPVSLDLTLPARMVNTKTLTLRADLLDAAGMIHWRTWTEVGTVGARRVADGSPVPTSITVFDHDPAGIGGGEPEPDSIRFYNGVGSITITLDDPSSVAGEEIEVWVTLGSLTASRTVTVLDEEAPGLFRRIVGRLEGDDLHWGPDDGVIHLDSSATVRGGDMLTIDPGTLIMVDAGLAGRGTFIQVLDSTLDASGTKDEPIFFFPTQGPEAMTLPQFDPNNFAAWRGIYHEGSGSATYRYVILTGAGNGLIRGHPRPAVLRFSDDFFVLIEDSHFADSPGKIVHGGGIGSHIIRRSLFSRVGIGVLLVGQNHHLLIEDCWFTRIGRSTDTGGLDGDTLHLDNSSNQLVQRTIMVDGGDSAVDHSRGSPTIRDSIIWDSRDKAMSLVGGGIDLDNILVFGSGAGVKGGGGDPAEPSDLVIRNTTIDTPDSVLSVAGTVDLENVVLTSVPAIGDCSNNIDYTLGPTADHMDCGVGNIMAADPLFTDPAGRDYTLRADSPAFNATPEGTVIGWLGFPAPTMCETDVDCDDGSPCTDDRCEPSGLCSHHAGNEDGVCDDGMECTSGDACASGICVGQQDCGIARECDAEGQCAVLPLTLVFQDGETYAGTHDTEIRQTSGTGNYGEREEWGWDIGTGDTIVAGLLSFDDLVGVTADRIPPGSVVVSATVSISVNNPTSAPAGTIQIVAVPWDEATASYNSFGPAPGVDPEDLGDPVAEAPIPVGRIETDVTAAAQAWIDDPESNFGLIFLPGSTNGIDVWSSEHPTPEERPMLTVEFRPGCLADIECDDRSFCNGLETCLAGVCQVAGAVDCDDGIACTADACSDELGGCENTIVDSFCDDGLFCNGLESCDPFSDCVSGPAPVLDDGIGCTLDLCDEAADLVEHGFDEGQCGLGIRVLYDTPSQVRWLGDGFDSWNVYTGDLGLLVATGAYTQVPGSNPLASQTCGLVSPAAVEVTAPLPGRVVFMLVSGVGSGIEGGLGLDSSGVFRGNDAACP